MNTLGNLKRYMGGRRLLLPLSLVLSGINSVVSLLPFVFIWLIVRVLLVTGGTIEGTSVGVYAWWAFGTAVAGVVLYFFSLMLSHLAAFRVEINLRREAMQRLVAMPLGFFDRNTSGEVRKIVDEGASEIHTFTAHLLPDLVGSILSPVIVIGLILFFDWRLGIACLIPLLLAFATMAYMMDPKRNKFQHMYLDALEKMSTEAVEYVRGIPVVKVFQQTVFSFKRFYDSIVTYSELVTQYTLGWQKPMSFYTTVIHASAFFLVPAAILLFGRSGDWTEVLADMFLYVLIAPVFAVNIMKIMYLQQNLFLAGESIDRIERLTMQPPLPQPEVPETMKGKQVDFRQVRFRYPGTSADVLRDLSFSIPEGKTYALVGPSGGGKTTIARLIPRFWDVTEGAVRIGGTDVRNIAKEELMRNVSFVFQHSGLFKTTLLENITYGNPHATQEAIERAIDLSQSREIIDRLPAGLHTRIGSEGTFLSGGEQQRIALARAILKDAPVVVLDEATAFADPENERLIQKALRGLMKGKTVLMIAHRLTSVQDVDRILVIEGGRIVQQGTHNELTAIEGTYQAMWKEYLKSVSWKL